MTNQQATHRVHGASSSVMVVGFDEVKEQASKYMESNQGGYVSERQKEGGWKVAWRFDPFYGMVKA